MKKIFIFLIAALVAIIGVSLTIAGGYLVYLGDTPFYVILGVIYCIASILLYKNKPVGLYLIYIAVIYTMIWALWERGLNFWPLLSRIMLPLGIAILSTLVFQKRTPMVKQIAYSFGGICTLFFICMLAGTLVPHNAIYNETQAFKQHPINENRPENWFAYAKTTQGDRFSSFTQINKENVKDLQVAWTYNTGDSGPGIDQNTPLQIDDKIYTCSRNNHLAALDADTGKAIWTFSPDAKSPVWQRCRSVSYYHDETADNAVCKKRIVMTTIDARLIEVDADTGKLCEDFGDKGTVNLKQNMGTVTPGFYFQTSSPLVARDRIIVGGWVVDNQEVNEPSGVIRAFNAKTGELEWAWDLGNPEITKYPPEGKTYTLETPNMWTHAAYDDKLGLVYIPLGNTTPDYYGGNRPKFSDEYNSSLVALDINTGREKWKFQTVHHDLWDYDLPAQPALIDVPDENGKTVPAIMQTTKRGQIFLLNRATGQPITKVEEKKVPSKTNIPGEYLSATQPYSTGMPTIGADHLTANKMWGMTLLDQLACRIQFNQVNYQGDFTPIDFKPSIEQPGNVGGLNWGSVSLDPLNQIAYVNDIRIPVLFWLVPRDEYAAAAKKYHADNTGHGPSPQKGTPYGMVTMVWLSSLGVPCVEPPYGTISAVDLKSKKLLWQTPVGTSKEVGPLGIKTYVPMEVGMPTYAGTMTTAGGLVFFAGSQDYYLRAFDSETGKEIWKHALPIGSSATPMTYISPKTGKQYIVISVGGAAESKNVGDYVIAFSLPDKK